MTTYTVTATATDAATDTITVSSATNMFSGMPIVFSGSVFGGITAGATFYIGTIVPGYPTSTITVTSLPGGAVFGLSTAAGTMTGTFNSGGQQIIDIGSVPNDGTGDPLRTAFNDTNLNFDQVFAAGPVGTNIQIANNTILTTNTNGNLVLAPNGTGIIQSNVTIVPNTANVRNLGSSAQRWSTIYAQYLDVSANLNIAGNIVYNGDLTVDGNLTVQGNIIQVGNIVTETLTIQLANAASTANAANGSGITVGANDDIATLIYNSTSNTWTTNIGVSSVGNITAPYFFGNGSQLTGLAATYGNANVVTLLSGFGSNTVSTTGNITGGYIFGNGSQLTGLAATYGNANVATLLADFGSNTVSTTGNITGNYFVGNGSLLTSLTGANVTGTVANATSATTAGTVTSNTQANITSVGTLTSLSSSGNVTGGNIRTSGIITAATGQDLILKAVSGYNADLMSNNGNNVVYVNDTAAYVQTVDGVGTVSLWTFGTSGNLTAPGNVSATGNVSGAYIKGNGSELTSLPAPVVTQDITSNGNMSIMTYDGNIKYVNYATVQPSSGNIAGGNITTTGLVSATGNITSGNISTGIITLTNGAVIRDTAGDAVAFGVNAGKTTQGIYGVAIGFEAGNISQGNSAVAIGENAGYNTQGDSAVAVGDGAGRDTQGQFAVALGYGAGNSNQANNSIILNATGSVLEQTTANTFTVKPVRQANTANAMYYDASTGEITYDIAGGGANTGNVTFNDVNIIGTGNLNLQPNSASNEFLNIYLTGNADIHVAAGGSGGNVILGTDEQANVAVLLDGNVAIQAGNVGGTKTWTFDTAGNLILPMGGVVYETNIPDGALSGSAIALTPPGGTNADQQLLVYPTVNDANHLHLTSGNLYSTELFLGSDNLYVKLANTGNVVVNSNDGVGNTAQWIFGTDGRLINLEGLTLTAGGQFNICTILTGGSGYDTGSALKATTGGSGTGMTVGIGYGLSNQLTNADVVDPGTGYVDGDVITVSGGTGGTFVITQYNDQANQGNNNFIESNWTFGAAGNLTLPGNIIAINYANGNRVTGNITFRDEIVIGTGTSNLISGLYLAPSSSSADANMYLRVRGNVNDEPTHIHFDTGNNQYFNQFIGDDNKYIQLANTGNIVINSNDAAGNSAQWIFNTAGTLTLPGGAVIRDTAGDAVAFGQNAGASGQAAGAVAIGVGAGQTTQQLTAVAVGDSAGYNTQGLGAVGVGAAAGFELQGEYAVALGYFAGNTSQGNAAVAVGAGAGTNNQGVHGVAIGTDAGATTQANRAVAIGYLAGSIAQGTAAVAIGYYAGELNQGNNSIIINATDTSLQQTTANTFTVAPVRNDVANVAQVMFYNDTSKEVTYGNVISVTGNITGNYIFGNGSQLTGIAASYGNANVVANLAALGSNPISTTGNITGGNLLGTNITGTLTTAAQANITTVGTLGNLAVSGQANITQQINTARVSATGNITGGNLVTAGLITVTGNITGSNVLTDGLVSATANITGGNILTAGLVTVTGNITGGNLITAGLATVTGNITGGNVLTAGLISATGNVSGGNLNVTGNIVDTGALTIITAASGNVTLAPNGTTVLTVTTTGIVGNVLAATTATAANNVGYLGMPQNATGTATLTIADAGRHIYVTSASQTITIPANSSVAYPIGTAIAFIAGPSATTVSIAITSDTMYLAGTGTTGTRTLAAYGMATAVKVAATTWYINGSGLT